MLSFIGPTVNTTLVFCLTVLSEFLKRKFSLACGADKENADPVIDIITCPTQYLNVAVTGMNGPKCQAFYVFPACALEID